ncbi:Scr1 family TA system antitoxin-like transcriptional regulator, partial [Kribbella sp.]|uniref:Scr1 family TA system antitoxin-like transcriptional regulator n=1 Tax=Kribbella sp. TaxID=1871183 RepID=UPI002D5EC6E7
FPQRDLPDIVYVEHLTSALYLDKRDDVEAYTQALELLASTSPPPRDTDQTLIRLLDRLG